MQRIWRGRIGRERLAESRKMRKSKPARRRSTVAPGRQNQLDPSLFAIKPGGKADKSKGRG